MKAIVFKVVLFLIGLVTFSESYGQSIQVCIRINGTAMPASKTWNICKANNVTPPSLSGVTLAASNCASAAQTNITISWKNLSVPPYTVISDDTIIANIAGDWEATIVDNTTSISYTEVLHLVYYAPISVTLVEPPYQIIPHGCPLSNYTFGTNTTGAVTNYSWFTYFPKELVIGANGSSLVTRKRNVFYMVEVSDVNNCMAADTSNNYLSGLNVMAINVGPDPAIFCEGNTFALASTIPSGYGAPTRIEWGINNTPMDTIIDTINSPSFTDPPAPILITPPAGTNTIWLKISTVTTCANLDEVIITTKPIPVVDLGISPILACYGTSTNLTATVTVGSPNYTYTWSSSPASSLPINSNISTNTNTIGINPTVNAVYTVSVTDANNCAAGTDNITVNVNPEIVTTTSGNAIICRYPVDSTTLTANATGGFGAITYQWSPSVGLATPTVATTKAYAAADRTYTITSKDANNCTDTETITVTSYVPPINVNTDPQVINEDVSTTLEASVNASLPTSGNNGASFEWTTSVNSTPFSSSSNIFLEYNSPDTVWYVVKITNPTPVNGSGLQCYNTDTIEIRSISNNTIMYVPNIFSPNAINPTNQTIKIYSDNILPDGFKWLIFNKWGNLMYETSNVVEAQTIGWDGGAMIEGVYSYVIVGKFKNNKDLKENEDYKGTFTLVK